MNLIVNTGWFFHALLHGGLGKHTAEFTLNEKVIVAKVIYVAGKCLTSCIGC